MKTLYLYKLNEEYILKKSTHTVQLPTVDC